MQKLSCALLVDDDQTTNYLNQLLLNRLAVTDKLLVALNGQEALKIVQTQCQDASPECPMLILLDVKMPVMNGFEFLEAFDQLTLPRKQAIIIVMLTTSLHPHDVSRLEQLHITGFMSKPLTKEKVNHILQTHFNRQLPAS